jgi:NADPH:quinone reductase-like Zn-dependent oxidoreductase
MTIAETMKAVQYDAYGPAREVLRIVEAPVPKPGPGDLLVRVRASSVNPIDCALRSGYGRAFFESRGVAKLPIRPGRDVAGDVVAVGAQVTKFKAGDPIYASVFYDANAEYVKLPEAVAAPKPASLSYQEAAAVPFGALTAWTALVKTAGLNESTTPGKRVLIPRGAGGVGSLGIQLIKAWGGYVASICSTRNVELVRSLGADLVIDYKKQDPRGLLRDFDVAFDTSFDTEQTLLDALKMHAGATYAGVVTPKLKLIDLFGLEEGVRRGEQFFAERVAAQKALGRNYHWVFAELDGEALRVIGRLIDAGRMRPLVDSVYPLERVAEAHELCESAQTRGRIIIDLGGADSA